MIQKFQKIGVIGAGTMGNGIAHVFAQSGYSVNLIDVSQERLDLALKTISGNIDRQIKKGTLTETDKTNLLANITTSTDLKTAVAERNLVVEAATENIDLKLKIFKDMDTFAPADCILATNTSSISITLLNPILLNISFKLGS